MQTDRQGLQDELCNYIYKSLLEECVWKTAVLEHKRARDYRSFVAEQAANASKKKASNDKHNSDIQIDCPVCSREMSATRFAPHLAKCLKLGARGQAAKKGLNSDLNKLGGLLSSDQQKNLKKIGNSQEPKKRGRPKKNAAGPSDSEALPPGSTSERPKKNIVTTPERDAMLSNAITNATQRLTMQKLTGTQASTNPITSFNRPSVPPHPLSQSHIIPSTSMADSGVPPPPKVMLKRKKKERSQSQRSRHSSQASSSSDSDYDMVTQDMDQEVDHGNANNLPSRSGGVQQGIENGIQPADTAPKKLDQVAPMSNVPQDSRITNPVPPPPAPVATSVGIPAPSPQIIPMRPPLKRKSSSQADSTDGTDSE